jgi:hypothetical protein
MSLLDSAKLPSLKDKQLEQEEARLEALRTKLEQEDEKEKVVIKKASKKN